MMITKICTKCNEDKTVDLFYKRSDQLGKYTSQCKACKRAHDNMHYAKLETKNSVAQYAKNRRTISDVKIAESVYKKTYNQLSYVKEAKKLQQRVRRLNPKVNEQERVRSAEYAKQHPAQFAMKTRKRKLAKLNRTPFWLNDGQLLEMQSIYKYCASLRATGLDYEVDHIVPLQGRTVSGLHAPWNLQVITASANASKGNRF